MKNKLFPPPTDEIANYYIQLFQNHSVCCYSDLKKLFISICWFSTMPKKKKFWFTIICFTGSKLSLSYKACL